MSCQAVWRKNIVFDRADDFFADFGLGHKDTSKSEISYPAATGYVLLTRAAKRPHFWRLLSSVFLNIFIKKCKKIRLQSRMFTGFEP